MADGDVIKKDDEKNEKATPPSAPANPEEDGETTKTKENNEDEYDPYYAPIVELPEIHVYTNEEMEEVILKLRAKLYRYDSSCEPPEWKERGTGEVKLLRHMQKPIVRLVMRRDKTLKVCANHFIRPWMKLSPNCGSDRAWVWSVNVDYADEEPKPELLAIKFANAADATKWFETFEMAKEIVKGDDTENENDESGSSDEDEAEEKESEDKTKKPSAEKADDETSTLTENLQSMKV
ncbi:ran-specific GTPase-activating protein-like [Neocloeon triangulifer]|uniref:ran-specific GTPase-activating protein-like n=1 Tax=Neocloeon triangulifer TaxID=2078957 RepID=UPI00286F78EE|nr:ran-specific GTPase-activating protein-like [Neocloeon triangulifer]